jgi:hypothetical protein
MADRPAGIPSRGYLYRNLAGRYARWFAVVAQAALFTLWATTIGAADSVDRMILLFTFGVWPRTTPESKTTTPRPTRRTASGKTAGAPRKRCSAG